MTELTQVAIGWNAPPLYYYLLWISVASLWMPFGRYFWLLPYGIFLVWAAWTGGIEPRGLVCHLAYLVICFNFLSNQNMKWGRSWLPKKVQLFFFLGFAFLLKQHLVSPGFNNWRVVSGVKLTPFSAPFSFWMNLDSSVVGLFLLGLDPITSFSTAQSRFLLICKKSLPTLAGAVGALLLSAWILGYVRFEPKWFSFTPLWLGSQLLFTCVGEEVLFRKYIQSNLIEKIGKIPGLVLGSVIFGLAHYSGGWINEVLGMIAGLFYGYAFLVTQSLEGAILVHFLVNAIHFLLFSYPSIG